MTATRAELESRVARAKKELADAETALAADRREENTEQLARVRATLREAKQRYAEFETEVKQLDAQIDRAQQDLENIQRRLGEHASDKPTILQLLPDDPDCVEWTAGQQRLLAEQQRISAKLRQLKDKVEPLRTEALRIADLVNNNLVFAERNLRNLLTTGNTSISWADGGGIFEVPAVPGLSKVV